MFSIDDARKFLIAADLFFEQDDGMPAQMLNLNDTLMWGCADCEQVPDEELPRLARLFWQYGWCGLLYWVTQRRECRAEFHDVNRAIDFVAAEEAILKEEPNPSKRAYLKRKYTIGE